MESATQSIVIRHWVALILLAKTAEFEFMAESFHIFTSSEHFQFFPIASTLEYWLTAVGLYVIS